MTDVVPEAASGVPEHQGGVQLQFVVVPLGGATPSGVWDDHRVGEHAQRIPHDRHLHRVTRRQVPQDP